MKQPVSFPVDPDTWKGLVLHNQAVILINEYDLHTEIEVESLEFLKAYERHKHGY